MCNAQGQYERIIFSKKLNRKNYRNVRSRQWGDLLPSDAVDIDNAAQFLVNEDVDYDDNNNLNPNMV